MKKFPSIAKLAGPVLVVAVAIGAWTALSVGLGPTSKLLLPSIVDVAGAFWADAPRLSTALAHTLSITILSIALSVALAFVLAVVLDAIVPLQRVLSPFLVLSQTVPTVFLYPLLLVWMGFGPQSRIVLIVVTCFFPLLLSLLQGLKSTEKGYLDLFRTHAAGFWPTLVWVKFPSAMPSFFAGLKISVTYSIGACVIAEWFGAREGIGAYMLYSFKGFQVSQVFAAIVVVSALSYLLFKMTEWIERRSTPWIKKETT